MDMAKMMVKLLQLLIVLTMLYPVYYVWETDKIYATCLQLTPGMNFQKLGLQLSDAGLNLTHMKGDPTRGDKWHALIESQASLTGYACEIRGLGTVVSGVRIIKGNNTP